MIRRFVIPHLLKIRLWRTKGKSKRAKGKREQKKRKKLRNKGFLTVFLKNGVAGGSKKRDFIGLLRFQRKNGGKNEQKLIRN